MTSVYARTREREKAWKFGLYCLAGAIVVAPFWYLIFKKWVLGHNTFIKVMLASSCYNTPLTHAAPVGVL
jgi:ER lumen protein retaining receptor